MNSDSPSDAELLDIADEFRSHYMHGGTRFDEFNALGFARAILARQTAPTQRKSPAKNQCGETCERAKLCAACADGIQAAQAEATMSPKHASGT